MTEQEFKAMQAEVERLTKENAALKNPPRKSVHSLPRLQPKVACQSMALVVSLLRCTKSNGKSFWHSLKRFKSLSKPMPLS